MTDHDTELAHAFDGQAARFERAPVQSDPAALRRLVAFAALPRGARLLDAGCGPGLVAEAFLAAGQGHQVVGVDLSPEMVRRARVRCARFGEAARFEQGSALELPGWERFDAAVSRYVVHHLTDAAGFVAALARRVRPGGLVVISDHTTDPAPEAARWHQEVERARDRTHTRNLTPGELADLLAAAGLEDVALAEEPFTLDLDEWFGRGTPAVTREEIGALVARGSARGFRPVARPDGGVTLGCVRALVRGRVPA